MSNHQTIFRTVTNEVLEQVLLVSVALNGKDVDSSGVAEMIRLVESASGAVVHRISQKRNRPDAGYFVGRGKAGEIAAEAENLGLTTIVFNHNLSPGQVSRLEEITKCKVIDRTELILAIFAVQARTPQAKLRIELAQLGYMLPRLSGMWHHLDRLGAGIGTRGPGETQLEVDRRRARTRMSSLEKKLEAIEAGAKVRHSRREGMFSVVLAGYTNSGKSTLLNRLCDAGVTSEDRLFATLDTTSRRLELPDGGSVIFSDTVGFIEKLPRSLLSSFRSTLDIVREADLILLLADAADPDRLTKVSTVTDTLEKIDAGSIDRITVWNKCDLPEASGTEEMAISALTGEGIDRLLELLQKKRREALDWCSVKVDICNGELEYWIRTNGIVDSFVRDDNSGAVEIICGMYLGLSHLRKKLGHQASNWVVEPLSADRGVREERS
ncbi:MAG: GTPase HflX [Candidatus Sabulitectum sp.]|nr:GTPase HflX [Candidatus Sabulitectum sp.]